MCNLTRDNITGNGADGTEILVSSYLISVLGQQVSVFITSPCENKFSLLQQFRVL